VSVAFVKGNGFIDKPVPDPVVTVYEPEVIRVKCGRVDIECDSSGHGTIEVDGKRVRCFALDLHLAVDEIATVTIKQHC
jgi:hypothetical protein